MSVTGKTADLIDVNSFKILSASVDNANGTANVSITFNDTLYTIGYCSQSNGNGQNCGDGLTNNILIESLGGYGQGGYTAVTFYPYGLGTTPYDVFYVEFTAFNKSGYIFYQKMDGTVWQIDQKGNITQVTSCLPAIIFAYTNVPPIVTVCPVPVQHSTTLTFKVLDQNDNPVQGVNVFAPQQAMHAITDSNGIAKIIVTYTTSMTTRIEVIGAGYTTLYDNIIDFSQTTSFTIHVNIPTIPACPSWGKLAPLGLGGYTCVGSGTPCLPGYYYDVSSQICKPADGQCPTGQLFLPTTGQCIINQASRKSVTINVVDAKTALAVTDAEITVKYSSQSCNTGSNGYCSLDLLTADSIWYITITASGYVTVSDFAIDISKNSTFTVDMTPTYTQPLVTCPSNATGIYPYCFCPSGYSYKQSSNSCVMNPAPVPESLLLILNGWYDSSSNLPIESGTYTVKDSSNNIVATGSIPAPGTSVDINVTQGETYTVISVAPNYETYSQTITIGSGNYTLTIKMKPKPSTIQCPSLASGTYPNCVCESGYNYQYSTNSCVAIQPEIVCPSNATGNYPNCTCDSPDQTYDLKDNTCIPIPCPSEASGSYPNCVCPSGYNYNKSSNSCVVNTPSCPSNATGSYPNCVCPSGYNYNKSSNSCVVNTPSCPSNASGTYPNCVCPSGYNYDKSSNSCVANQSVQSVCPAGTTGTYPNCVPISKSKPWYDQWWIWLLGILILMILVFYFGRK